MTQGEEASKISWLKNTGFEEQKLHANTGFDAVAQTQ